MKRFLTLLTIALSLVIINHSCKPKEEELGSIYGVVTDKATGEPVKNANVQLRPSGETSLTGIDGRYEFLDLKNGNYSITVSKTGYTDLVDDYVITVEGSKEMRRDVQIEKLPAALRVVDDSGNDINELDFGSSNDDLSRMFSIFNDGVNTLNYSIVKTAAWITSISSESGTLQAGATMPIVVVIDRDKMSVGDNKTTLHITSNDGSKQMTIKAEKLGKVSTLEAEEVNSNEAILKACVNIDVPYSERGFYYGTNTNSLTKVVVDGTGMGVYKHQLYNLEEGKKYYYKAYLINNSETVYGEMKEFTTKAFFIAQGCGPGGCDLMVCTETLGMAMWSTIGLDDLSSIDFSHIDGHINMNLLKNYCQDLSYFPAAQQCAQKGSDWYFPSVEEFKNIYNKYYDKFPKDQFFWTSTYVGYDYCVDENGEIGGQYYSVYTLHRFEEDGQGYYGWWPRPINASKVYVLPVKRAN